MDQRIADYIRANRDRYTREAIRQQLVDAGYDPAVIERTWAILDTPDADDVAGPGFWRRFALILLGVNVGIFLVVGLLSGMLLNVGASAVLLIIFAVVLVIGALIAWGIVALTGPARMNPTTATVIGSIIPLFFALLIGGSCYALVGTIGPPPRSGTMELTLGPPLELSASGPAMCSSRGVGFSVNTSELRTDDGRTMNASLYVPPANAGGPSVPELFVGFFQAAADDAPVSWSPGPDTVVSVDAAPDGLSGSATFEGLAPELFGPPGSEPPVGTEPLSGTLTWTCE
jgi:hypothetical protein